MPEKKTTRRPPQAAPEPVSIDAELLARVGRLLFGSRWHKELGQALEISERYVHFLADGERPMTDAVAGRLRDLVLARVSELRSLCVELGIRERELAGGRP